MTDIVEWLRKDVENVRAKVAADEIETLRQLVKELEVEVKRLDTGWREANGDVLERDFALTAERDMSDKLEKALKYIMEWQVGNVNKWHNSAYDSASKALAELKHLRNANPALRKG